MMQPLDIYVIRNHNLGGIQQENKQNNPTGPYCILKKEVFNETVCILLLYMLLLKFVASAVPPWASKDRFCTFGGSGRIYIVRGMTEPRRE